MRAVCVCGDDAKKLQGYSRVPSNRVAMVSRKVFWGAKSPLRAGISSTGCLSMSFCNFF